MVPLAELAQLSYSIPLDIGGLDDGPSLLGLGLLKGASGQAAAPRDELPSSHP
jgi:hypothetical protein